MESLAVTEQAGMEQVSEVEVQPVTVAPLVSSEDPVASSKPMVEELIDDIS
jgi:hypothetical protein